MTCANLQRAQGQAGTAAAPTLPSATWERHFLTRERHCELPPAKQREKRKPKEPIAPSPCPGHTGDATHAAGDATHAAGDATHLSVWQHCRNKWRQMIQTVPAHLQPRENSLLTQIRQICSVLEA